MTASTPTPKAYWHEAKTKAFKAFLAKEGWRLDGYEIGLDGVWIYSKGDWVADDLTHNFRAASETAAIADFYARVRKADPAEMTEQAAYHAGRLADYVATCEAAEAAEAAEWTPEPDYWAAPPETEFHKEGRAAFASGLPRLYGPHFGFRSAYEAAKADFLAGWDMAKAEAATRDRHAAEIATLLAEVPEAPEGSVWTYEAEPEPAEVGPHIPHVRVTERVEGQILGVWSIPLHLNTLDFWLDRIEADKSAAEVLALFGRS